MYRQVENLKTSFCQITEEAAICLSNSLLEDAARQCIWIGMEGYLFQYNPTTGEMKAIEVFHNNSIKSLALDGDENLLAGTDNGLYVYQNDKDLCSISFTIHAISSH